MVKRATEIKIAYTEYLNLYIYIYIQDIHIDFLLPVAIMIK